MSKFYFDVLPKRQAVLWKRFSSASEKLKSSRLYLAGGTALALQLGHRQSLDFDFFSQKSGFGPNLHRWLQSFPDFILREMDENTLHAELQKTKVSFIGGYRYPLIRRPLEVEGIQLASIADIALMKLLAITHRATLRDYLDLAAILRGPISLGTLLTLSRKKYGKRFNFLIPLKALVSFEDLDRETPVMLDKEIGKNWKNILRQAVREVG